MQKAGIKRLVGVLRELKLHPYDTNVNANGNLHATLRMIFRNERFISQV